MTRPSQIIVLTEDQRQRNFVSRYLKRAGVETHQLRFNPERSWQGAGEQRVRENYPGEVRKLRARQSRVQTRLIVVIDADTEAVRHRLDQLDTELRNSGQRPIDFGSDPIARLIPRRNIETWLLCLTGENVDELTDYKHDGDWTQMIRLAAMRMYEWTRLPDQQTANTLDSLRLGVQELKRLNF